MASVKTKKISNILGKPYSSTRTIYGPTNIRTQNFIDIRKRTVLDFIQKDIKISILIYIHG